MERLAQAFDGVTLRQRLVLVAVLCALLCAVPTWRLGAQAQARLHAVSVERDALPANKAWQKLLAALNAHRLAAAVVRARPDGEAVRQRSAEGAEQAFGEVDLALAANSQQRRDRVLALRADFMALSDASANGALQFPMLLKRHRALADRVIDEIEQLNGDAGLLVDDDAGTHYTILAGLQIAPQIGDALSELGAIAAAASVDDVANVAAAAGRYNAGSHRLAQVLELAARLDPERQAEQLAVRDAALKQQAMVSETLDASAADVNYPLDKMSATFVEAADLQARLAAQVLGGVDQRLNEREVQLQRDAAWLFGVMALGLGAVGLLLWRTISGILGPVMQAIEATERIAAGDLGKPVRTARRDEMGRVLNAIEAMQERLRGLVRRLQEVAGEIHVAADEIAAGNQDLSHRSEQSATQMEVAAGSIEALSGTVAATAKAADEASRLAGLASRSAERGGQVVGQFLSTMTGISESSRRIAEIIGVIDGIAFQTNILALNAAVEAARAGEQGRGFAVVASEVRGLAQRSATAAREIKVLIDASATQVENGSRQIGEASAAMAQVTQGIDRVSGMIRGIATDAAQESARMHELSASITKIDQMTQQNAALVEQSAAATHSMNEQAEQMSALATGFRLTSP
ncbi:methyl-accepting chemotaxis protein [Roseateles sp.]|uniref:methyl-accepting chemotaxis protein n=1 Tax=Roseateles sp. TaxID=1971397 RepID=UPI0025FD0940|nr:methyl-accepting chemotaxis protein [Roseateles sp.]MBV8036571.1 HAMP domain-containing protein [Roseateles sp.]